MARSKGPLQSTMLFRAGEGGYTIYRIPALVVSTRGTLLAFCEARRNDAADWGAIDIVMRRSEDGTTWEPARKISPSDVVVAVNSVSPARAGNDPSARTWNNVTPIVDRRTGAIHVLLCAEYAQCFHMASTDDGITWSAPVEITSAFAAFRGEYDWRCLATGPCHGIQLRNGRLLAPLWMSTGTGGNAHRPSCVSVITSDDGGASWQRGEIVANDGDVASGGEPIRNPSESVAVELADGSVLLSMRSESSRQRRLVSISADGATGWSKPAFDDALFEPTCCASILGLDAEGATRIVFANPDSHASPVGPNNWGAWPRENLTMRLSEDGGRTWPVARVLDPAYAGYSDLAMGPDGSVYCLYEGGVPGGVVTRDNNLVLARFGVAWLTGSDPR
ncbi:MAG: sialidase family protein [Anaerolineae bacterium]